MINHFYCHVDLDDPAKLAPALRKVSGNEQITICKVDHERIEDIPPQGVVAEWIRREGHFGLDLDVWGPDIFPHETEARWARALAKELGRALLFSDCSAFPFSYYMADPDGSIWYVVIKVDEEDIFDLASDDPANPDGFIPKLVFASDEELPERSPERPLHWTHGQTSCEQNIAGKPCLPFNLPCPKYSRNILSQ
jgi:hypothetical protein